MPVETTGGGLKMAEPDRTKVAADWASRGFSCDLWTDPPGQRWEDFRHVADEVVTVLGGQKEFEVAGAVHHTKTGEEHLTPAGAVHTARNVGKTTARWRYGYRRPGEGCGRSSRGGHNP
jgi:mannose-6-phosphate isomerase-like protein (cupin superfamily)